MTQDEKALVWLLKEINSEGLRYRAAVNEGDEYLLGVADGRLDAYVRAGWYLGIADKPFLVEKVREAKADTTG